MAYSVGKTSALQTAIKAGVDIAIAEFNAAVAAGDPVPSMLDRVNEVKDMLVVELFAQVDDDNAAIGGGSSKPTQGPATLEDAKTMVVTFGMYKGLTLGDVLLMSREEAVSYTNGKAKGPGIEYVKWLAANTDPKNAHVTARAKLLLDNYNQQSRDLGSLAG